MSIEEYILSKYYERNGRVVSKKTDLDVGKPNGKNYRYINIKQKLYSEHRLIWLLVNGKFPDKYLDHIDGNPLNNCISNLRECDQSENMGNAKKSKANTSGFRGIAWKPDHKSWCARIMKNGKSIHVGYFKSFDEAKKEYIKKFNSIFGEFSKFNDKNIAIWQ